MKLLIFRNSVSTSTLVKEIISNSNELDKNSYGKMILNYTNEIKDKFIK